jgi:hypothetical protein
MTGKFDSTNGGRRTSATIVVIPVTKLVFTLLFAGAAFAGEYAVLQNGFRIRADRHEVSGQTTKLYTSSGLVELPSEQIASFEVEEYVAPKPEPAPVPAPVVAAKPVELTPQQLVDEAAKKHGLRPEFVRSVASTESAFKVNAVSPKGALGVMQLMPGTAAELGANPLDPKQNVEAGTRYLRQLLEKYKSHPDGVRLALAAYNAGPGAVDRYRTIPPYRETQAYVEKVVRRYLEQLKAGT